jgi:CheY-like chemotaxis protein
LCVDDEPRVLDGLALQLGRSYEVHSATSGSVALEILRAKGPFAVVLSDMRMPNMNGAAFLANVRTEFPDAVRMLLTGYSDIDSAIDAVNGGQVFRFLSKPCAPDTLRQAFAAALSQHRLVTAERVLLEQTLRGSIKTLIDILSLTNPVAFGRATRVRDTAMGISAALPLKPSWELEVTAMLAQLGNVVLPEIVLERYYRGQPLSVQEQAMLDRAAAHTDELLANIPRLEKIREWITEINGYTLLPTSSPPRHWKDQCIELKILRVVNDYDRLGSEGLEPQRAVEALRSRTGWYDEAVLDALGKLRQASGESQIRELSASALAAGMTLIADVRTNSGFLVLARGHVFTASSVERLRNYATGVLKEPIRVLAKS